VVPELERVASARSGGAEAAQGPSPKEAARKAAKAASRNAVIPSETDVEALVKAEVAKKKGHTLLGLAVTRVDAPASGESVHRAIELSGGPLEKGTLHMDLRWRKFRPFSATSMLYRPGGPADVSVAGVLFVHLLQADALAELKAVRAELTCGKASKSSVVRDGSFSPKFDEMFVFNSLTIRPQSTKSLTVRLKSKDKDIGYWTIPVRQIIKAKRMFGSWELSAVESGKVRLAITWRELSSDESDAADWADSGASSGPRNALQRGIQRLGTQVRVVKALQEAVTSNPVTSVTGKVTGAVTSKMAKRRPRECAGPPAACARTCSEASPRSR